VALAASSLEKKLKKNTKKILLYSMYNKMYKIFFFVWKKNSIVFSDFSAFKIKVTALPIFIFLLYF
jgi:hypothetical protein